MYKKIVIAVMLCMHLSGCVGMKEKSQNLVSECPSGWEGMVKINTQIKRSGKWCFELYGEYRTEIVSSEMIPVDTEKAYNLSAWMRTLDEKFPASGYMGLYMYDKNKKSITMKNVSVYPDTETTLAVGVTESSKEMQIVKNTKWANALNQAIAFNTEDDYRDIPNFDISSPIENIFDNGNKYNVILRDPLNKSYPAGTKIRLHSPWAQPFLYAAQGWMPTEWKEFSMSIKGEAQVGEHRDKFRRGTKYVRVFVIFGNWNRIPKEEARLLIDDIKFSLE